MQVEQAMVDEVVAIDGIHSENQKIAGSFLMSKCQAVPLHNPKRQVADDGWHTR